MVSKPETKPEVELVGHDGNAFAILGRCTRAARRAGWSSEQVAAFTAEATKGDYSDLLATAMDWFEVS